jgi:hypothetical protein
VQNNFRCLAWSGPRGRLFRGFSPALLIVLSFAAGCHRPIPNSGDPNGDAAARAQFDVIRQELDTIPPPSKTRYLAIKSLTDWQNPFLTVQDHMLTLHVTVADANQSGLGVGGILRPVGARRQDLNIRTEDLPAALNAVPETAWPYGRVVALEEAHDAPASARPQLRRNMEAAIKRLSDLGVVVYEWQEGGASLH